MEVLTQQTVDQILPKFIQDRELSAAGGDGGEENMASRINPFKRKTDLPVVFWSGIIDTDSSTRQLIYQVPDYFNGTIRVMAVAVSPDSLGSQETNSLVRGDFVINPNVPTFVAPGDEFEISSSVANNIKDSGEHAQITVQIKASPEIEILGSASQSLEIREGQEQTVHFKLKAKSILGSAKITFTANAENSKSAKMDATLSVRPATPLVTYINSGLAYEANKTLDVIQTFYPQFRNINATVSTSPLILVYGLQRYLENYPYGCTEQLTSKALPLLAMNSQSFFTKDSNQISKNINATIEMLSQRQMSHGGFSYWPGLSDYEGNSFASIYAMQFLTEARLQGFNVPNDMFSNGLGYLQSIARLTPTDLNEARIEAYAIYILTTNEIVTSNYLANLQEFLQKEKSAAWKKDITGVYLAGAYQLLKSFDAAKDLISHYDPKEIKEYDTDFYDNNSANAQYLLIVAKHFPDLLNKVSDKVLIPLIANINKNDINTLLSGYFSLALSAYPQNNSKDSINSLSITQTYIDNQQKISPSTQPNYQKLDIKPDVKQITFNNPEKNAFFYQLIQAGFDKTIPDQPIKQGLEIFREYKDASGNTITTTTLGQEIEVHIQIRALENQYLTNIAIEDLLPGGFEVVRDSVKTENMDYADAREDRVNYFGSIDATAKQIVYKIKAINPGKYAVPPAFAEAMYDPELKARGVAGEITVTNNNP